MWRASIVILSLIMVVGGLGCAALSYYVTPAEIDRAAVKYAVEAGVADANEYGGYPNLLKAERLPKDVDAANVLNQEELRHRIERDNTQHDIHRKATKHNYAVAKRREEVVFGERGLLSLGLSMAGFGTLTGFVGLMRKRPTDYTKEELETAISEAGVEVGIKERQMLEVVQGVQKFFNTYRMTTDNKEAVLVKELKGALTMAQSGDTRKVVAAMKTS